MAPDGIGEVRHGVSSFLHVCRERRVDTPDDPGIVQMHSSEYRNPSQLRPGTALLVGLGNSGAEIAYEVARTHPVWLSGPPAGQIPVPHGTVRFRLLIPVVRFMGQHVLTMRTPMGRKVGPKLARQATPLIRIKLRRLAAAGVQRGPRVAGGGHGRPQLEDGRALDVAIVIWCTGFRPDYSWIDLPVFGGDGLPMHRRGVAESEPGLYFLGLVFQYAPTSDVLPGVGRDARYIAKQIASSHVGGPLPVSQLTAA